MALTNIEAALKDLHKVIECSPDDKVAHADRECLLALKLGRIGDDGFSVQYGCGDGELRHGGVLESMRDVDEVAEY